MFNRRDPMPAFIKAITENLCHPMRTISVRAFARCCGVGSSTAHTWVKRRGLPTNSGGVRIQEGFDWLLRKGLVIEAYRLSQISNKEKKSEL